MAEAGNKRNLAECFFKEPLPVTLRLIDIS